MPSERKTKRARRELKSLRSRSNPHVYDKRYIERKRRLVSQYSRLRAAKSESAES